jgi:hypothetical protein
MTITYPFVIVELVFAIFNNGLFNRRFRFNQWTFAPPIANRHSRDIF